MTAALSVAQKETLDQVAAGVYTLEKLICVWVKFSMAQIINMLTEHLHEHTAIIEAIK